MTMHVAPSHTSWWSKQNCRNSGGKMKYNSDYQKYGDTKIRNIARGTTDPGYWVHNSNHHPWQISFWRWNDIHIWLKEPGSESKAWIIFEADHLSHLVHLPVVLLVHHHLNDNHHLPNSPTTYIVADIITLHQCPTFPATLAPPYRPP